jgi:hypothetical protein
MFRERVIGSDPDVAVEPLAGKKRGGFSERHQVRADLTDREATRCDDRVSEANMTVANMIEIVVVLAIL